MAAPAAAAMYAVNRAREARHDRQERRRENPNAPGMGKKLGVVAMAGLAAFGGYKIFSQFSGFNLFKSETNTVAEDLVIEVQRTYASEDFCFAVQESKPSVKLTKERTKSAGPLTWKDHMSTQMDAEAATSMCIDHKLTTRDITLTNGVPTESNINITFAKMKNDITSIETTNNGSWQETVNPFASNDYSDLTSLAYDVTRSMTIGAACNEYTAQVASKSAIESFTQESLDYGVPRENIHINVQYAMDLSETIPEGFIDNNEVQRRTGIELDKSYRVEVVAKNCAELLLDGDNTVLDFNWQDAPNGGNQQAAGMPS